MQSMDVILNVNGWKRLETSDFSLEPL